LPGQLGNSAIARHRTTYGAPFDDLNRLAKNDKISIRTRIGTWNYVLNNDPVKPDQAAVLLPTIDSRQQIATLMLTACNPKFSASRRLVVKARLTQPPLPAPRSRTGSYSAPVSRARKSRAHPP
jgi:sortase A